MTLQIQPIDQPEAFAFVKRLHRHHRPPLGCKFCIGVNDGTKLVGVLVAGRPVARMLDNGTTLEVTRCCTDGTRNACSILYAAAWRAARAIGYVRMVTYTLPDEGGASLRAAGWVRIGEAGGGNWFRVNQPRHSRHTEEHLLGIKWRWEVSSGTVERFGVEGEAGAQPDLFEGVEDSRG